MTQTKALKAILEQTEKEMKKEKVGKYEQGITQVQVIFYFAALHVSSPAFRFNWNL